MKKNFFIVLGCAILVMLSASAYCSQGPYFSGNLGLALLKDSSMSNSELNDMGASVDIESKSGVGLGVALGYDFGNSMRIEGEFAYQRNDTDKFTVSAMGYRVSLGLDGHTSSSCVMVNGYYDFTNLGRVAPFLSAGIGYSKVKQEITGLSGYDDVTDGEEIDIKSREDDTALAYQVGAGIGYAVSKTLTIDAKYRYFTTDDLNFNGISVKYSSHNFYIGVRLGF